MMRIRVIVLCAHRATEWELMLGITKFIADSNYSLLFINTPDSIVHGRFNASKTTINSLAWCIYRLCIVARAYRQRGRQAERLQTIEKGVNDASFKLHATYLVHAAKYFGRRRRRRRRATRLIAMANTKRRYSAKKNIYVIYTRSIRCEETLGTGGRNKYKSRYVACLACTSNIN